MDPKNHQPANLFMYHILPRSDWAKAQASGIYEPESLTTEGFIHCSLSDQVIRVANAYYARQKDLLLLRIDMGNGIKLGLGYYTKLEAIKVLKALTMYVDSTKPQLPKTYLIPGLATSANLFIPPGS